MYINTYICMYINIRNTNQILLIKLKHAKMQNELINPVLSVLHPLYIHTYIPKYECIFNLSIVNRNERFTRIRPKHVKI